MYRLLLSYLVLTICSSCVSNKIPTNLVGVWQKVGYGQVLDDKTEYIEDVHHKICPNDVYGFTNDQLHFVRTYNTMSEDCEQDFFEQRRYTVEDSIINVNKGDYIYSIQELQPNFLKLYLHQHEFSGTDSDDNETIFIYTFIKSKNLK